MQIRIRNTVSGLPVHVGVDRVVLITELLAVVLPVVALVLLMFMMLLMAWWLLAAEVVIDNDIAWL